MKRAALIALSVVAAAFWTSAADAQTTYGAPPTYGTPQPYGAQPYGASQTPPPATDPYGRPMQAGGLAPPPPMGDPNATQGQNGVANDIDQGHEEDSGRGLTWVWLEAEGGYSHVGLSTFEVNENDLTAGLVESSADGPMIGAGLGLRLVFVTLGARARVGFYSPWELFTVGGELGFRIPLGDFEPHFALGGGYAGLGSVQSAVEGADGAVDIAGFYARAGGGLDYFVTPTFSVGANVSWELLGLTRPGLDTAAIGRIQSGSNAANAEADVLAAEGSGYGSSLGISAVLGLHF